MVVKETVAPLFTEVDEAVVLAPSGAKLLTVTWVEVEVLSPVWVSVTSQVRVKEGACAEVVATEKVLVPVVVVWFKLALETVHL